MSETEQQLYRRLGPEFAADTDDVINAWLADAASEMDANEWRGQYVRATVYLALHLRKVADLSAQAAAAGGAGIGLLGVASSIREGDLSISLLASAGGASANSPSKEAYARTIYGQQYMRLRDATIARVAIRRPGL